MKRSVISGTPRNISINATHSSLTSDKSARRTKFSTFSLGRTRANSTTVSKTRVTPVSRSGTVLLSNLCTTSAAPVNGNRANNKISLRASADITMPMSKSSAMTMRRGSHRRMLPMSQLSRMPVGRLRLLRRPSARAMPMGKLITIPATARSRFSIRPPQWITDTGCRPGTPGNPLSRTSVMAKESTASMASQRVAPNGVYRARAQPTARAGMLASSRRRTSMPIVSRL